MTFGERLVELRRERGFLNRNDFANYIGMPSTTLRNYETNVREPGHIFLKQMSDIFHVSIDYLLCMTDDKTPPAQQQGISSEEYDHIKKYRFISHYDETGKTILDSLMNCLYDKIKQSQEKEARIKELEITTLPTRIISYYQKLASAGSGEYLFDEIPCDNIVVPENSLSEKADFVIGVNGHSMEPTYRDGDKVYVEISEEIPTGSIGIFIRGNECFIKELGTDRLISHNADKDTYPDIPATTDIRCVGLVLGKAEEL